MNSQPPRNAIRIDNFADCLDGCYMYKKSCWYYGNACIICFKSVNVKKCGGCGLVPYCCRDHQRSDWASHKLICRKLRMAHESIKSQAYCSFEEFTQYRKNLYREIERNSSVVSDLEEEICKFPWVCHICYSRNNLIFECIDCKAVVYCSFEHKQQDEEEHKNHCSKLKLCRIYDSITYKEGFNLKMVPSKCNKIPRSIKSFTVIMGQAESYIRNQISRLTPMQQQMNYIIHFDFFLSAATIINGLETIGLVHNRVLTSKPFLTNWEREMRYLARIREQVDLNFSCALTKYPNFVIHFVAAGRYEMNMPWFIVIPLITNWLLNVDFVGVVLVGTTLKHCNESDFSVLRFSSRFLVCPELYKDVVKKLRKPDVIVLFNYGYHRSSIDEFDDFESQRALFKYKRKPVIVTSMREETLINFVDKLMEIPDVQVQVDTHKNQYSEVQPRKIWDNKNVSTCEANQYMAILTRH